MPLFYWLQTNLELLENTICFMMLFSMTHEFTKFIERRWLVAVAGIVQYSLILFTHLKCMSLYTGLLYSLAFLLGFFLLLAKNNLYEVYFLQQCEKLITIHNEEIGLLRNQKIVISHYTIGEVLEKPESTLVVNRCNSNKDEENLNNTHYQFLNQSMDQPMHQAEQAHNLPLRQADTQSILFDNMHLLGVLDIKLKSDFNCRDSNENSYSCNNEKPKHQPGKGVDLEDVVVQLKGTPLK